MIRVFLSLSVFGEWGSSTHPLVTLWFGFHKKFRFLKEGIDQPYLSLLSVWFEGYFLALWVYAFFKVMVMVILKIQAFSVLCLHHLVHTLEVYFRSSHVFMVVQDKSQVKL